MCYFIVGDKICCVLGVLFKGGVKFSKLLRGGGGVAHKGGGLTDLECFLGVLGKKG